MRTRQTMMLGLTLDVSPQGLEKPTQMENKSQPSKVTARWHWHLSALGAGFFFVNVIPHLVSGVQGREFPSPLAEPPGVGMSSPTVNVVWAMANALLGYVLLRHSRATPQNRISMMLLFIGAFACALTCSIAFSG